MSLSPAPLSYLRGLPGSVNTIDFEAEEARGWVIPVSKKGQDGMLPVRFDIELTLRQRRPSHRNLFNNLRMGDGPIDVTLSLREVEQEVMLPVRVPAETMEDSLQHEQLLRLIADRSRRLNGRLEVVDREARTVLGELLSGR